MKEIMKEIILMLVKMIGILIIALAVYGLWVALELYYYGEIQFREVDNIIYGIVVVSLYFNFKYLLYIAVYAMHQKYIDEKGMNES